MPLTPSHGYPNGYRDDNIPGPSQSSPSQCFLSQMLPVQAPLVQRADLHPTPASAPGQPSRPEAVQPAFPGVRSLNATPQKIGLRLSHPPPAPSSSYLHHNATPRSKRTRFSHDDLRSATTASSPPSQTSNSLNGSSAPTEPLSSPSVSNVRPLSGMARPLPTPPNPSPSQRSSHLNTPNAPLIPMPQRGIEDFEKLLPRRQPAAVRPSNVDVPQRALLQTIPPQPPAPVPAPAFNTPVAQTRGPLPPAKETLPTRRGWSLTGFRSFDLDLERIAEVVSLDAAHASGSDEPDRLETHASKTRDASRPASSNSRRIKPPFLGLPDRGLPSGSILEVLGPPGSGKSSFALQFAVTERLRSLGQSRAALVEHGEDADASMEAEPPDSAFSDSYYFTEDFWDAEVASADQVLLIDCEGALTPEKITDAAWAAVFSLWISSEEHQQDTRGTHAATKGAATRPSLGQNRAAMPEEVRRLVAAVLAGIHVSRITSLAGLIALLHSLRPTDELNDGQLRRALPSAMPPRTSLILIDSLSYHMRSSGGSSQDRKSAARLTERIREMLLRLQKPFEFEPQSELSIEEQEAARQRSRDAAAKLCSPTIVFTNQLGVRRGRSELDASGRSSPSGRSSMGVGSGRPFNKGNTRGEGSSMLAPLLNGLRPPQPARMRDERPAPSVALGGPEMWEGESPATASPRRLQDLGGHNPPTQPMGYDRGWPPSFLGQDVWRILLFRHGTFGHRYAQMVSMPPAIQSELSILWAQTRERVRARAAAAQTGAERSAVVASAQAEAEAGQTTSDIPSEAQQIERQQTNGDEQSTGDKDKQMLELLSQLRASLFRWRPFHVTSRGLAS